MEIKQYGVYWLNLDPTLGSEVNKTRSCVILSPDEMNRYIKTVVIAPLTHTIIPYPSRVNCKVDGQQGSVMLDQMRTVDKTRIGRRIGKISSKEVSDVKYVINQMLC